MDCTQPENLSSTGIEAALWTSRRAGGAKRALFSMARSTVDVARGQTVTRHLPLHRLLHRRFAQLRYYAQSRRAMEGGPRRKDTRVTVKALT